MIGAPLNDVACLSQFTAVARGALERDELRGLAQRFLEASDYDTEAALGMARSWLREKPQKDDTGQGPEPRVNCGTVQQRVDYLGREPNCVERTIAYTAIAELIDPSTVRQMATIGTQGGLHTFPVEGGRYPVVLDPRVTRNGLRAGIWSLRNGASSEGFTPIEIVSWALYLAEGEAAVVRNGPSRLANAERALERLWDTEPLGESDCGVRNSIADIAWTFALAEQAARVAGGHGVDAMRVGSMAVQRLLQNRAQTRNLSLGSLGRRVIKVGRRAQRLAGPALKAYLMSNGVPPQAVDRVAAEIQTRSDIKLGSLGFQEPAAPSLQTISQQPDTKTTAEAEGR